LVLGSETPQESNLYIRGLSIQDRTRQVYVWATSDYRALQARGPALPLQCDVMKPQKSCEYHLAVLLRHVWLNSSCKMPLCAEQLLGQDSQDLNQGLQEAVLADALESGLIEVIKERVSCCALEDRMS
jgi:hypothetical protein